MEEQEIDFSTGTIDLYRIGNGRFGGGKLGEEVLVDLCLFPLIIHTPLPKQDHTISA